MTSEYAEEDRVKSWSENGRGLIAPVRSSEKDELAIVQVRRCDAEERKSSSMRQVLSVRRCCRAQIHPKQLSQEKASRQAVEYSPATAANSSAALTVHGQDPNSLVIRL